jgi:hypothetical protein
MKWAPKKFSPEMLATGGWGDWGAEGNEGKINKCNYKSKAIEAKM